MTLGDMAGRETSANPYYLTCSPEILFGFIFFADLHGDFAVENCRGARHI